MSGCLPLVSPLEASCTIQPVAFFDVASDCESRRPPETFFEFPGISSPGISGTIPQQQVQRLGYAHSNWQQDQTKVFSLSQGAVSALCPLPRDRPKRTAIRTGVLYLPRQTAEGD